MVIITRVVYETVRLWSQHHIIASCSEGRRFKPRHEFSQYIITYNYKADRHARVCMGANSAHIDLMSVTFGACSGIIIHIAFIFYFFPQLLFKCSVMWSLKFFFFLSFCLFVQKITHQERLLDDTIGRKQGGPPKTDDHTFFCTITKIRYSFKAGIKEDLYSPCTPVLSPDHFALSPLDAPFGFIGSNSENICCVQSEC